MYSHSFFLSAPPTIKETVQPICNGTDLKVRNLESLELVRFAEAESAKWQVFCHLAQDRGTTCAADVDRLDISLRTCFRHCTNDDIIGFDPRLLASLRAGRVGAPRRQLHTQDFLCR